MRLGSVFFVGIGFTLAVIVFLGGYLVLVDDVPAWTLFTGFVSLVFLVLVPTMLGFSIANLPNGIARDDERLQLRTVAISGAISLLLGLIGFAVVGSETPAGVPVLAILVVGSLLVIALSVLLGLRRHRALALKPVDPTVPLPVTREVLIRKVIWVAMTIVLGTAAGTAALASFAVYLGDPDGSADAGSWILFGLSAGLIAGSVSCIAVSWAWVPAMRAEIGDDPAVQRAVRSAVFGAHPDTLELGLEPDLDDDALVRATRWAALQAAHLPFAAGQLGLLMLGLLLQAAWNLIVGNVMGFATFTTVILIVSAVLLATAVIVGVVRTQRARSFAAAHAELLDARVVLSSATDPP